MALTLMSSARARGAAFDPSRWTHAALNFDAGEEYRGAHDVHVASLGVAGLERASSTLLRYHIFPPHRMRSLVCTPDCKVRTGAIVIQRVFLGPIAIEMAVRVLSVWDKHDAPGMRSVGFSYATLEGHAERGTAAFELIDRAAAELELRIETWSAPGSLLFRVGKPVARAVQMRFTRDALSHFRAEFDAE